MPANRGNIILTVLLIVTMLIGIVAGVYLVRERQTLESEAAVPGGQATVSLTPSTGSFNVGDSIQMSVFFNTANIPVSGVAIRLRYPFTGTSPELSVSSIDVNSSFLNSPDWTCPTISSSEEGTEMIIDVACANTSATGYATGSDTLLAQVTLSVDSVPVENPMTIIFDPTLSVVTQKTTGQDILAIPENDGSYTIIGDAEVTETPVPTDSATTTVTPTATLTPTMSPTGTITTTVTITATPTPEELPDAGFSLPTLIGLGFGFVIILFAGMLLAL